MLVDFDGYDAEKINDILRDYRDRVASGDILPNQAKQFELNDVDKILEKLADLLN